MLEVVSGRMWPLDSVLECADHCIVRNERMTRSDSRRQIGGCGRSITFVTWSLCIGFMFLNLFCNIPFLCAYSHHIYISLFLHGFVTVFSSIKLLCTDSSQFPFFAWWTYVGLLLILLDYVVNLWQRCVCVKEMGSKSLN